MSRISLIVIRICCLSVFAVSYSPQTLSLVSGQQQAPRRGMGVQTTERRVALVIGNAAYKVGRPLNNPVNDARDMADALQRLGFEVIRGENLSQQEMDGRIRQFGEELRQSNVGLFYYAGHGLQVDNSNYLIPVDADLRSKTEVIYKTINVGQVLGQMEEASNRLNIVILDACRDNPFRSFRSSSGGLASITPGGGQVYISYATAANSTAADGSGRNGLFTAELLKQIKEPGLALQELFKRVRAEVKSKSGGKQVPFEYSSIVEDFYFAPNSGKVVRPPPPVDKYKEQPNDSIVSPQPAAASEIFEITPWNFHPHPTMDYKVFLEPNMLKICFITVTHPQMLPAQFDCSTLPEGKWMRLLGQTNINLPIQVQRRGLNMYAQWLRQ